MTHSSSTPNRFQLTSYDIVGDSLSIFPRIFSCIFFDSLELYQEAIRLVTPLLHARHLDALIACVILCCLEMMSASAKDWRRNLERCAALFDTFNTNGFSGGVLQAEFWCYAMM